MTLFESDTAEWRELLPADGSARYRAGFLTPTASDETLRALVAEVPWESRSITLFGRQVPQPRLACWFGDESYSYSGITLDPRPWSPLLADLKGAVEGATGQVFNSVLVNLYRDGNDSMGWHADDEPELGPEPVIASVSLGRTRRFRLRHGETRRIVEVDLESGSLLVMSGLSQARWMHEVPKSKRIVEPRINLTFRRVFPDLRR